MLFHALINGKYKSAHLLMQHIRIKKLSNPNEEVLKPGKNQMKAQAAHLIIPSSKKFIELVEFEEDVN